jgi:APA family basic amino acid/polyamine antiporter
MLGYVGGDLLNSPRAVYALARDGYLPRALAGIHPRFKTPWLAIVIYAALVVVVTNSGTFAQLAIVSNVAILSLYLMGCIAAMALARRDVREAGGTPFTLAGAGTVAPVVASAFIVWLLWHATWQEFAVQGVVLAAAAVGLPLRRRLS